MSLTLLDWRRRVADLYRAVRESADPAAAHPLWCRVREDMLRTHVDSPVPAAERDAFRLEVPSYDPRLRFDVVVDTSLPPTQVQFSTGTDGVVRFDRIGRASAPGIGDLDVWWLASYGGGVFVPVKDAAAGGSTYGGGRYLVDTAKGADLGGADGRLVLDFNFCYNPSCAYDPAWACPLAPPGNTVSVPILAGELTAPT